MRLTELSLITSLTFALFGCGGSNTVAPPDGGTTGTDNQVQHVFHGACDEGNTPFGAGDGTVANPYQICHVRHLNSLANTDYAASNFVMITDIDLANGPVQQIPNVKGIFDGNNHVINNWTGEGPLATTVSGTVKNLQVQNANLTGAYRVGIIAGTVADTGSVINCHVTGTINASYMVGGIAGFNAGNITSSTANTTIVGTDHLGGLVGTNIGTITGCTAAGSITGSTGQLDEGVEGGLVAWNDGNNGVTSGGGIITLSSAVTTVTGQNGVGGLVGMDHQGTISQCSSGGTVRGNDGVGGFVGITYQSVITNSYSLAQVVGSSGAGGFVGHNGSGLSNDFSAGAVAGGANTGGFSGTATYVYQPSGTPPPAPTTYNGTTSGCYWDTQASGQPASGTSSDLGRTTAQMLTGATFSGWNFSTIWNLPSGAYPTLR